MYMYLARGHVRTLDTVTEERHLQSLCSTTTQADKKKNLMFLGTLQFCVRAHGSRT